MTTLFPGFFVFVVVLSLKLSDVSSQTPVEEEEEEEDDSRERGSGVVSRL